MNQLDFTGRHAVITGGATGLGFGIAQRLVASGGSVTLWDRDEAAANKAAEALGDKAFALKVDVSQQPSVAKAVAATLAHAGRIDALVNSAGITGPNTKLWDYPVDDWRQVMEVNINGVFLCCREVVGQMRKQGYGRIVNIASVAGKEGNPNASAYSASKAAVIGLTKSLGKELADTGIRVNCVTPAAVKTAIFDQMTPEHIASCCRKFPWAASARWKRWPRWSAGSAPKIVRFPPARSSTSPAAAPLIDHSMH
jgi:NAD(P)-dependent dehydrogenase (short-subunit alcohol dehydrogenase family)